jgi:hypothetical protein
MLLLLLLLHFIILSLLSWNKCIFMHH